MLHLKTCACFSSNQHQILLCPGLDVQLDSSSPYVLCMLDASTTFSIPASITMIHSVLADRYLHST